MASPKNNRRSDDREVLINFKTTAGYRKELKKLALDLDMNLTELVLAALAEYKERHQLKK